MTMQNAQSGQPARCQPWNVAKSTQQKNSLVRHYNANKLVCIPHIGVHSSTGHKQTHAISRVTLPSVKGAITSKIKHAIKLKTSPARLAQLLHNCCNLQPSLAFCFSLQPMTASRTGRYAVIGCKLNQNANEGCNSCASLAGLVLSFIMSPLRRHIFVCFFGKRGVFRP